MSAISQFLAQIQNAVYGEQVRSAIVNAITQCYDDVNDPSLQTDAFSAAIEAAYADGFLDIQEKSTVAGMTNQSIIYRYTGNEAGYVNNALYYHNGTSWVPVGSGVRSASLASQMNDTGAIYRYTGSETGYKTNALYYHNGTSWVPVSPENFTKETSPTAISGNLFDKSTMLEDKVITVNGISSSASYKIASVPVTSGKTYSAQAKTLAWSGSTGIAFLNSSDEMVYYAYLGSEMSGGYAVLNKAVRLKTYQGDQTTKFITRDISEKGICFEVPSDIVKVAIQVVRPSYDSTDDFMIEEGRVCSEYVPYSGGAAGENITTIFGYPLADKYLRGTAVKKSDVGYYQLSGGKNIFDITSMILGGYTCSAGDLVPQSDASGDAVALVPIVGGKTYSIQRKYAKWAGNGAVVLVDENLNKLHAVGISADAANGDFYYPTTYGVTDATGEPVGVVIASPDATNRGLTVTTTENTAYLAFNFYISGNIAKNIQVEEGSVCTAYEPYSAYGGTEISSLFGANLVDVVAREALGLDDGGGGGSSGKKYSGVEWVAIGDSITVGGGGGGGYYVNEIANKYGFNLINAAHSGVGYGAIRVQSDEITNSTKICTVMLGTNDTTYTDAQLGELGDQTWDTLYGCIYMGIHKILTEHPNIILGIIIPVPRYRTDSEHVHVRRMAQAIKESCEYYCIPHLDLHGQIGFAVETADVYYQGDHLHPSVAGSHRMALAIGQWMESLLGDL